MFHGMTSQPVCFSQFVRWARRVAVRAPAVTGVLAFLVTLPEAELRAQNPILSEFVAANASGLRDADGDYSDWIEIYNPADTAVSLGGWFLSADRKNLAQWVFPDVSLPSRGFLLVYASAKDRPDPHGELHTNFRLGRAGEFLALVRPDGVTVASAFAPTYPAQVSDVSYGVAMDIETTVLVPAGGSGRVWIPEDDRWGAGWTQPDFDDSSWLPAVMSLGYERPGAGSEPLEPPPALVDVTQADDLIVPTSVNSPGGEDVTKAIDGDSQTKYLNFDKLNAGFTVTPAAGTSVVTGLRLTSANDAPDRDPTSYLLSGSNDGVGFAEIARGKIPSFAGRFVAMTVTFTNTVAYRHFRLLFPTVRDPAAAVAVQIAEVELLGRAGDPPAALADLIQTDVGAAMYGRAASIYVRMPFTAAAPPVAGQLILGVRSEDGFVAYLNGVEVARGNVPAKPAWNSTAVTNRFQNQAVVEQRYGLGPAAMVVRPGTNVLAFQGLNSRADSRDFLLSARLESSRLTPGGPGYFESPTPGSANSTPKLGLVAEPSFDRPHGFCASAIEVAVSCPTEGATVRFTTNGSVPTPTNGTVYSGPLRIGRTTVLRAVAFHDGWRSSRVITSTYFFLNDIVAQDRAGALAAGLPPTWSGQAADYGLDPRVVGTAGRDAYGGKYTRSFKTDLQSLPSVSIVAEMADLFGPQGIYAHPENHGDAWERAASVEWIDPAGGVGFQEDAGIRIQGGAFRRFDLSLKKSFRLVFREKYGSSELRYPLFGPAAAARFDNLILRANSNDAWPYGGGSAVYVRDAFAMETARAMGMVASHTTFVHLYINGLYWGLYNPVERPDAAFSATYHGGDKDTWDAINQDSVPDGNYDAWNRLNDLLGQDASRTDVFERLQGDNPDGVRNPEYEDLLDVGNMIDYLILNFYVGNTDWPGRNWWVGRDRNNGDGFHFYPWDTETALGFSGLEADVTGVNSAVARAYAAVRGNVDFRMRFADRVYHHFFNAGALYVNPSSPAWNPAQPEHNQPAARFAALAELVRQAMVGESARWGDQLITSVFTRDEHWQSQRDSLLANYFPRRSAIVLDQFRRAGLYPRLEAPVMSQRGGQVGSGFTLTLSTGAGAIYYTTNGTDPRAPVTIEELSRRTLVGRTAAKRVLVPSSMNGGDQLSDRWQGGHEPFNDGSWLTGTGGVGYDQQADYLPHIQTEVRDAMAGKNGSAFVRIPFDYDGTDRDRLNFLTLRAQYDDGFVAFLNGVRIVAVNAPPDLQWNSVATAANPDTAAVQFAEFKADDALGALRVGSNVLTVQGLNQAPSSSDFLLNAELVAGIRRVSGLTNHALSYTGPLTLSDLTIVKARAFDGQEWSALNEATFVVGAPDLVLSELHFHPAKPTPAEMAAGFANADDFEFIELFNAGRTTCDLRGVRFVTGIQFDFAGSGVTQLAPGRYVLVVKNRAAFDLRYGSGRPVAGEYSGRLDNAGEVLELIDGRGATIFNFGYGTHAPWPEAPDGTGPSLEVVEPHENLAAAANWRASAAAGGSPGDPNPAPLLAVRQVAIEDGRLGFWFDGQAGSSYRVYIRESLTAGDWQLVERGPVMRNEPVSVRVDLMPGTATRFFRVSVP